jgi:23S rRNA pseudouridine1911/1915/1917 synthase
MSNSLENQINIVVSELPVAVRLDVYLAGLESLNLTRSFIGTLIEDGQILLNVKAVKASHKVKNGDAISINLPPPRSLDILPEAIPLNIIFEDEYLLVLNKQAGLVVHPSSNTVNGTLVNALLHHCKDSLSQINGVLRPGIVHRLDKDTTGLMLACKNDLAHKRLAEQIKNREVERYYQTLVLGNLRETSGSVIKPIGRDHNDRKRMRTFETLEHARYAKTNWQLLKRYKYKASQDPFTLLECKLDTGRTHQIRVHMNYIKHPIIGDAVYGIEKNKLKAYRPLLHSYKLEFTHPITEERLKFETDLPEDFKTSLSFLEENLH